MLDLVTEHVYNILDHHVFDFTPIRRHYLMATGLTEDDLHDIRATLEDINALKNHVYNHLLVYEPEVKQHFLRILREKIDRYPEAEVENQVIDVLAKSRRLRPREPRGDAHIITPVSGRLSLSFYEPHDADLLQKDAALLVPVYLDRLARVAEFLQTLRPDSPLESAPPKLENRSIFIVHGHNNAVKNEVARFVEQLDLQPIILHEQASEGKTIIEKIERYSRVQYAIILLTADDQGKALAEKKTRPRARQNVVLELGYFAGILGRGNVCCLVDNSQLELPSDISGVVYIPLGGNWKVDLLKELLHAGFAIDTNRLFGPN
ncbi:TIR domain-containing protein [Hymenobacter jejuensis]|nr:nucleotide-binding protein [Hymenobacter jejuensis]